MERVRTGPSGGNTSADGTPEACEASTSSRLPGATVNAAFQAIFRRCEQVIFGPAADLVTAERIALQGEIALKQERIAKHRRLRKGELSPKRRARVEAGLPPPPPRQRKPLRPLPPLPAAEESAGDAGVAVEPPDEHPRVPPAEGAAMVLAGVPAPSDLSVYPQPPAQLAAWAKRVLRMTCGPRGGRSKATLRHLARLGRVLMMLGATPQQADPSKIRELAWAEVPGLVELLNGEEGLQRFLRSLPSGIRSALERLAVYTEQGRKRGLWSWTRRGILVRFALLWRIAVPTDERPSRCPHRRPVYRVVRGFCRQALALLFPPNPETGTPYHVNTFSNWELLMRRAGLLWTEQPDAGEPDAVVGPSGWALNEYWLGEPEGEKAPQNPLTTPSSPFFGDPTSEPSRSSGTGGVLSAPSGSSPPPDT